MKIIKFPSTAVRAVAGLPEVTSSMFDRRMEAEFAASYFGQRLLSVPGLDEATRAEARRWVYEGIPLRKYHKGRAVE